MEDAQKISILAVCSGYSTVKQESAVEGASISVAAPLTNDDFIKYAFYEDIAGLLSQCKHRTAPRQHAVYVNAASSTPCQE